MSEEQQSAIQRATDLVNAGNYTEALETSRSVLVVEPNNADAKLIEAISLSQLGNVRDASEAFAEAVRLNPGDLRIRFNAAVHENNAGNIQQAKNLAEEVIGADPNHQGAKDLLLQISQRVTPSPGSYPRPESTPEVPYEGIAFLRNRGPAWTAIGWAISAFSLLFFAYFWMTIGPHFNEFAQAAQSNDPNATKDLAMRISNPILSYMPYILLISNLVWMIMDIIHRKGNFLWLIAHIPCTCCGTMMGGNFLTLPLYMLLGRK